MSDHPLEGHRLRDDPVTTSAFHRAAVGTQPFIAVSDGFLVMRPEMVGSPSAPTGGHDALAATYGEARLPVGCFVVPGDVTVLIDTGVGPQHRSAEGRMLGGNLLPALSRLGIAPMDIDIVALSHLHGDHVGTVADPDTALPVFPNARHIIGTADWTFFVESDAGGLAPHIHTGLEAMMSDGRVELVDSDADITAHLRRIAAPGHTPGHCVFSIHDGGDRVLVLGDAMYCPQQLTEIEWSVAWDVDPGLARRTRERLARDLEVHGGGAVGCHFPELAVARLLS